MNSRYILQSILINKDDDKLTDATHWILENNLKVDLIEEDDKYFRILQTELSKEYFPIQFETVNRELGINFLYYSKYMFPIPVVCAKP